ncbi:hypothetical protein BDA99DRAFT_360030 [Phascolomyces articulosus]|uniref:Uncharacterized protein n=1 Tax=Phascolomyces articulosus TaxID=60185 RepID=A0AAD5KJ23_9FUNG|nr:hypothetical protein BDA99DRAFT_360030 [Phascolomyces articulosus]
MLMDECLQIYVVARYWILVHTMPYHPLIVMRQCYIHILLEAVKRNQHIYYSTCRLLLYMFLIFGFPFGQLDGLHPMLTGYFVRLYCTF